MFWPFNIPAKRREREAQQQREAAARLQRIKEDIEAENRRQEARFATITGAQGFRQAAAVQRQAGLRAVPAQNAAAASYPVSYDAYIDPLSPISPLSPLSTISQAGTWSAPAEEPRHSSSHCGNSSSHSHDSGSSWTSSDHGSSHSHSPHDHGCSGSSYDSGSSSSSSD